MSESLTKIWKYRLGAFIIDLIFIFLIAAFFRNINPFIIPVWIEYLVPFFSFFLYFMGLSLIKGRDYSFGKAALNISVQYSEEYDLRRLFLRILIIALIWPLRLQELPGKFFGGDFNEAFGIVLFSIQYSFILYSIFLALKTGKMLQDSLTNSYIKFSPLDSDESYSNPIDEEGASFYKPFVIISVFIVITSGSFVANQIFSDTLLFETAIKTELEKELQDYIYNGTDIRSNVEIWDSKYLSRDLVNNTSKDEIIFNMDIWIPMIQWKRSDVEMILKSIEKDIDIDTEYYDRYEFKMRSAFAEMNLTKEI